VSKLVHDHLLDGQMPLLFFSLVGVVPEKMKNTRALVAFNLLLLAGFLVGDGLFLEG